MMISSCKIFLPDILARNIKKVTKALKFNGRKLVQKSITFIQFQNKFFLLHTHVVSNPSTYDLHQVLIPSVGIGDNKILQFENLMKNSISLFAAKKYCPKKSCPFLWCVLRILCRKDNTFRT